MEYETGSTSVCGLLGKWLKLSASVVKPLEVQHRISSACMFHDIFIRTLKPVQAA